MSAEALLKELGAIKDAATVKRVFGDPIVVGEKTFVPIASVHAGFGGGFGKGTQKGEKGEAGKAEAGGQGEGAGGGGGMCARPVAVIEITEEHTTLHHIIDHTPIVIGGMVLSGIAMLVFGGIFGRKRD